MKEKIADVKSTLAVFGVHHATPLLGPNHIHNIISLLEKFVNNQHRANCKNGRYITPNCPNIEAPTAKLSAVFEKKPNSKIDLVSDRHETALNKSNNTNVVNVMVVSLAVTTPSFISITYTNNVPTSMINPDIKTLRKTLLLSIGALRGRGGNIMLLWSGGSTPNDWAGGPSIRILIHRICMAFKGFGRPNAVDTAISDSAATLVLNWNVKKF
ncbi:hypothetical protein AYI68_g7248 [Smittium mucronatum]|uniref:Uncharacterized protein n=1 Tax=Smittium mucronatum TaxID=133383 RepID=A0A1R0GP75_9FUNG|nr:hypothetical protein AYI68_g7248 [Smittium mucronatum]